MPYAQDLTSCARNVSTLVPENERVIISTDAYAVVDGVTNNYLQ